MEERKRDKEKEDRMRERERERFASLIRTYVKRNVDDTAVTILQ